MSFSIIGVSLFSASSIFGFVRFLKLAAWFSSKSWQASIFIWQSCFFATSTFFGQVRFLKSASIFSVKVLVNLAQALSSGSSFLASQILGKIILKQVFRQVLALAFFQFHVDFVDKVRLVKNFVACKIKSGWWWFWFSVSESCASRTCPTQRAPDGWESARFQVVCVA